jgi:glutathione synthase/RimK-type ligase-like ATP-grasp enzyme
MEPLLAIHDRPGSFSDRWKSYCEREDIPYMPVDCFDTNIIQQLASAHGLLWHWYHMMPADVLAARHILMAAEAMGAAVFPSTSTCWYFDDKVAQKYLLEAVNAPLVSTCIFYRLEDALQWIDNASFPKVFKLRRGAGSANVSLVRNRRQAVALAKSAFSSGFRPVPEYWQDAGKRYRTAKRQRDFLPALKRLPTALNNIRQLNRMIGRERGYIYFQDFVPDNQFDTRVTVIGNRAFAYIRNVRPGDFRASGSGDIDYDVGKINLSCVRSAFETAQKIGSQSMALDFVLTPDKRPMIVEISYCYVSDFVHNCAGHWDRQLNWHGGQVWPEEAIIEDLVRDISQRRPHRSLTVLAK